MAFADDVKQTAATDAGDASLFREDLAAVKVNLGGREPAFGAGA